MNAAHEGEKGANGGLERDGGNKKDRGGGHSRDAPGNTPGADGPDRRL